MKRANAFSGDPYGPPPRLPRVRFDAIGEAWRLYKAQWMTWVVAGLIVLVGNWLLYCVLSFIVPIRLPVGGEGFRVVVPPARTMIPAVIASVANGLLMGGLFRMACLQVRGRRIWPGDYATVTDVLAELFLGSALWGLGVWVAAAFCFIPAFIVAGVWMFMFPLIVDARLNAFEAIGRSWRALRGQWLGATLFHVVAGLVAGLGGCCFFVGLLVTMPLYCLSIAVLYRDFFPDPRLDAAVKSHPLDPDF